jgi:hypothetical protein
MNQISCLNKTSLIDDAQVAQKSGSISGATVLKEAIGGTNTAKAPFSL